MPERDSLFRNTCAHTGHTHPISRTIVWAWVWLLATHSSKPTVAHAHLSCGLTHFLEFIRSGNTVPVTAAAPLASAHVHQSCLLWRNCTKRKIMTESLPEFPHDSRTANLEQSGSEYPTLHSHLENSRHVPWPEHERAGPQTLIDRKKSIPFCKYQDWCGCYEVR